MKIDFKKKDNSRTYVLEKTWDIYSHEPLFRLREDSGKITMVSHNYSFLNSFCNRLEESGHKVIIDDSMSQDAPPEAPPEFSDESGVTV